MTHRIIFLNVANFFRAVYYDEHSGCSDIDFSEMKVMMKWIILLLPLSVMAVQTSEHPLPYPLEETRYCGEPVRLTDGSIRRRSDVLRAFKKAHPCPVTGQSTGACPGWSMDHVIPLAVGGCDAVSNLQWLPNEIKSASGSTPKDRWELRLYGSPFTKLNSN